MTVVFRALKVKSIISDGTCILPESSSVSIVRAVSHAVEQAMTVAAFSRSFLDTPAIKISSLLFNTRYVKPQVEK